jgi:hypothetical protein
MKQLALVLAILILLPLSPLLGQERIDIIYLKNGDILKGTIIENVPNDHVRIELPGGSVFIVKYSDILKFTREKPSTPEPTIHDRTTELTTQPDAQKLMTYQSERKSSSTAVLLSIFVTSAGHAYAGNWGRGLLFTAGRACGVVLALTAGVQTKTYSEPNPYGYSWNYYYSYTEVTPWLYIGIGIAVVFSVWEAFDASWEVDRYNDELYNRIMGRKPFGLNIVPTRNGPQLQFSFTM